MNSSRDNLRIIISGLMILIGLTIAIRQTGLAFAQNAEGHSDCLSCHSTPNMVGKFYDGGTVSLYFDASEHEDSIHAKRGLGCRACHTEQDVYPHNQSSQDNCMVCHKPMLIGEEPSENAPLVFDIPLESPRDLSLHINQECKRCHQTQDLEAVDSDHTRVMEMGNSYAPVCVDCHGSHDVLSVSESRSTSPKICSKCHLSVYTTYQGSIHGAALNENTNMDVPTCGSCHGTHTVRGPDQTNFRVDTIVICGECHSNEALMSKYGISTDVFNTYLNDFHGRAVDYSRKSGIQKVDEATCNDCHGVHNILPPENTASTVYPANIQHTCQKCHADAGITFPQAWLSHKVPNRDTSPVLYIVDSIYKVLIPVIIGGCIVYIAFDVRHRIFSRLKDEHKDTVHRNYKK